MNDTRRADDKISVGLDARDVVSDPPANSDFSNSYLILALLCFVSLINYMDRFAIGGILDQVQKFYSLNDAQAGLVHTSFIVSYMCIAPVFGYLGDRFNRSIIMASGVLFWSTAVFIGSFVPSDYFALFILLRSMVGIGEATSAVLSPTVIGDLFHGVARSRAIVLYYFTLPVGIGLGYIVSSTASVVFGNWQWALRITPGIGVMCSVLIVIVVKDPPRGLSEGGTHLQTTTLSKDLRYLLNNPSFLLSTVGFTCVVFATGTLAWWAPSYFQKASVVYGLEESINVVSFKFGIITCVSGVVGIVSGYICSQLYQKYNEEADAVICGVGALLAAPVIFLSCVLAHKIPNLSWFLIFIGEVFLSSNWALIIDILLYVVIPTRRSIADALQTLFYHALGDGLSPYVTGAISDAIKTSETQTPNIDYYSLQFSMFLSCFMLVLGGWFFLWSTKYIVEDRRRCGSATSEERTPLVT